MCSFPRLTEKAIFSKYFGSFYPKKKDDGCRFHCAFLRSKARLSDGAGGHLLSVIYGRKDCLVLIPVGGLIQGARGEDVLLGMLGGGRIGVGGRALEIRAFINLAILWRGKKKSKKTEWELFIT